MNGVCVSERTVMECYGMLWNVACVCVHTNKSHLCCLGTKYISFLASYSIS